MKVEKIKTSFGDVVVISEDNGMTGVYTRRDGFCDLKHQFTMDESFLQVYFEAFDLVNTDFYTWQGECDKDDDLTEEELNKRMMES